MIFLPLCRKRFQSIGTISFMKVNCQTFLFYDLKSVIMKKSLLTRLLCSKKRTSQCLFDYQERSLQLFSHLNGIRMPLNNH